MTTDYWLPFIFGVSFVEIIYLSSEHVRVLGLKGLAVRVFTILERLGKSCNFGLIFLQSVISICSNVIIRQITGILRTNLS